MPMTSVPFTCRVLVPLAGLTYSDQKLTLRAPLNAGAQVWVVSSVRTAWIVTSSETLQAIWVGTSNKKPLSWKSIVQVSAAPTKQRVGAVANGALAMASRITGPGAVWRID